MSARSGKWQRISGGVYIESRYDGCIYKKKGRIERCASKRAVEMRGSRWKGRESELAREFTVITGIAEIPGRFIRTSREGRGRRLGSGA